jgi:hypothetical protein
MPIKCIDYPTVLWNYKDDFLLSDPCDNLLAALCDHSMIPLLHNATARRLCDLYVDYICPDMCSAEEYAIADKFTRDCVSTCKAWEAATKIRVVIWCQSTVHKTAATRLYPEHPYSCSSSGVCHIVLSSCKTVFSVMSSFPDIPSQLLFSPKLVTCSLQLDMLLLNVKHMLELSWDTCSKVVVSLSQRVKPGPMITTLHKVHIAKCT